MLMSVVKKAASLRLRMWVMSKTRENENRKRVSRVRGGRLPLWETSHL